MGIRVFKSSGVDELESKVNQWLRKNPEAKFVKELVSSRLTVSGSEKCLVIISYKKEAANGFTSADGFIEEITKEWKESNEAFLKMAEETDREFLGEIKEQGKRIDDFFRKFEELQERKEKVLEEFDEKEEELFRMLTGEDDENDEDEK